MDVSTTRLFHCEDCYSHDLQWRAFVSWDVMKQEMVIDSVDKDVEDGAYCFDCGQDVKVGHSVIYNRRFDNHGFYKTDKD